MFRLAPWNVWVGDFQDRSWIYFSICWARSFFCVLQRALKQFLVCFDPIEQHFNALFKIDFRFPAQFTFGFAEVRIKNALIAGAPICARDLNFLSEQPFKDGTEFLPDC